MKNLLKQISKYNSIIKQTGFNYSYAVGIATPTNILQNNTSSKRLALYQQISRQQFNSLQYVNKFLFSDQPEESENKSEPKQEPKEKFEFKVDQQQQDSKSFKLKSEADSLKSIGKYQEAANLYEEAIKEFEKENNFSGIEGTSLQLGMTYNFMRQFEKSLHTFQKLMEIQLKRYPKTHFFIGSTHINIGAAYNNMRQYNKAREEIELGIGIVKQNIGEKHLIVASAYYGLGFSLHYMGILDKARENYEKSLSLKTQISSQEDFELATIVKQLAQVNFDMGNKEKAFENFTKSVQIKEKIKAHPMDICQDYSQLGQIYHINKDYENAKIFYDKALEIKVKFLPKTHLYIAESYLNLAKLKNDIFLYDDAIQFLEKAYDIHQQKKGNEMNICELLGYMGFVYSNKQDWNKAEEVFTKQKDIVDSKLPNTLSQGDVHINLGSVLQMKLNYKEALKHYEEALKIKQNIHNVDDHLDLGIINYNIGRTLRLMNENDTSLKYLLKAYQIFNKENIHLDKADTLFNIGSVYIMQHKFDEALKSFQEELEIRKTRQGGEHLQTSDTYRNISMAYFGLKNLEEVKKNLKLCHEIRNKQLTQADPRMKDVEELLKIFNMTLD